MKGIKRYIRQSKNHSKCTFQFLSNSFCPLLGKSHRKRFWEQTLATYKYLLHFYSFILNEINRNCISSYNISVYGMFSYNYGCCTTTLYNSVMQQWTAKPKIEKWLVQLLELICLCWTDWRSKNCSMFVLSQKRKRTITELPY